MKKKRLMLLSLLVLIPGAVLSFWRPWASSGPSAKTVALAKEGKKFFEDLSKLSPEDAAAKIAEARDRSAKMSDQEKRDIGREMFRQWTDDLTSQYKKAVTKEEKDAFLDEQIDKMESMVKTMETLRAVGGAFGGLFGGQGRRPGTAGNTTAGTEKSNPPTGTSPESNGASPSQPSAEDRELLRRKWLESTPPEQMAMMMTYWYDTAQRRKERGLPAMGFGGGPGR
jgi:hypothetical protein